MLAVISSTNYLWIFLFTAYFFDYLIKLETHLSFLLRSFGFDMWFRELCAAQRGVLSHPDTLRVHFQFVVRMSFTVNTCILCKVLIVERCTGVFYTLLFLIIERRN